MINQRNMLLLPAVLAAVSAGGVAMAKDSKHCPPGLAKKSPACVPPGQAKKMDRHRDPRRGDRIDDYDDYRWLEDYDRYDLQRLPRGQRYYVLNGRLYNVNQSTYEILDFVRAFSAILN